MIADCPGCAPAATDVREPGRARARLPWLGLLPGILFALAPKCPLCLAAYLSAFGVTVGMTSLALSVLGPLAVASVVLALGFALWPGAGDRVLVICPLRRLWRVVLTVVNK
jgi:hypothetical protein